MAIMVMLNNFLHDFCAAGWLFATILMAAVLRMDCGDANGKETAAHMLGVLLFLTRITIVGIIVFGLIRAFAYKNYEWNAQVGRNQVTLVAVKHVIFMIIFVAGMVYYVKANRLVRRLRNDKGK